VSRILRRLSLLVGLLACLLGGEVWADAYEARLPPQLTSDPALCAHVPCGEVVPGADSFSTRKGRPPYVEAYRTEDGRQRLVGYAFLSTDIVDIPAYSGKPVVTLIGMDTQGVFTGIKILRHSEPILLLGIPEAALERHIRQYVGKHVGARIEIGAARREPAVIGLDAITGATVTVIAENQVLMRSAVAVAKQVGILKPTLRQKAFFKTLPDKLDWQAMADEGSVQHLTVSAAEIGLPDEGQPYIDLWFGLLDNPAVGRSLLGEAQWRQLMKERQPGEHAIFIVASGSGSFKGSGFVRGGIYDRIQVVQEGDTFTFRDRDYVNLYGIEAPGAPAYKESGIFILRGGDSFSAAYPWRLVFLANKIDRATGAKTFASFAAEYWVPARYLDGGRPQVARPDPTWWRMWQEKTLEIALFAGLLGYVSVAYALRDQLTRRSSRKDKRWINVPKYIAWFASIGFVGWYALAHPSITHVLTWFHSLLSNWNWELFLSDPLIFIFWWFIIITVFVWGRGLFCGWMCPFGALSELMFKLGRLLGLGRFQRYGLPATWHHRLKWVKYGVFLGLLAVSAYSISLAEKLAEVEPFKTTFVIGLLNRSWPYSLYAAALLGLSIFIERPFCKYLCPLGAALAMPTTFRWFGLKRKQECQTCTACAKTCGAMAIDPQGRIDHRECMLCLDCMVFYYDTHTCPPLAQERRTRSRAGLPLTPIGANGYYIPIKPVPLGAPSAAAPSPPQSARLPLPHYAAHERAPARFGHEVWDHLWPWSRHGFETARFWQALSLAAAVAASVVWILAATHRVGAAAVVAAWVGWSVFEIFVRLQSKPYVKMGPWWGRNYRPASVMDMVSYVSFKNLLLGATLFLALKSFGLMGE
jgi:NosR/NirI family transcriptional regulator, nitrous oxide reductase regulator